MVFVLAKRVMILSSLPLLRRGTKSEPGPRGPQHGTTCRDELGGTDTCNLWAKSLRSPYPNDATPPASQYGTCPVTTYQNLAHPYALRPFRVRNRRRVFSNRAEG